MSYSSIVPCTAVVMVEARSVILTMCGTSRIATDRKSHTGMYVFNLLCI